MSRLSSIGWGLVLFGLLGWSRPSWAADARVVSSITTLELETDGSARIRQQLHLETASGALQTLEVSGIAADAQLSPEAHALRTDHGAAATAASPLDLILQDGRATLTPPQVLRGKSFTVEFGYELLLTEHGALRLLSDGQHAELVWVGSIFEEAPDSATLVVRAIAATQPPKAADPSTERVLAGGANSGIVLSTLRRSAETDELEVVLRLSRGEAPRWRILLDRNVLEATTAPPVVEESALASVDLDGIWPEPEHRTPRVPLTHVLPWVLAAALGYALLVTAKSRAVRRAAALRDCQVLALVRMSANQRAAACGLLLAAASVAVLWLDSPPLGALTLLVALALASYRPATFETRLRGPGQWQPLDAAALEPVPAPALPGAWLDVGRAPGAVLLLTLLAGVSTLALRVFERSPYHGACLLLASVALLPVFCTGRAAELPAPPLAESRRFLRRALRRLAGKGELVAQPLGRSCTGASELDELRLAIHPTRALEGLIGIELAIELQPSLAGQSSSPVVIVRAAEGSLCQRALPRQLSWTRGRSAEERAALVRPKLPSVALAVALVRELSAAASEPPANERSERRRQPTRRPPRTAGAHAS
ncbi:MAG: hypothetical protein RL685_5285 [Pseudomonadota bacterium]|jgi:hypothetical protein